jgi:hypothetical protein
LADGVVTPSTAAICFVAHATVARDGVGLRTPVAIAPGAAIAIALTV